MLMPLSCMSTRRGMAWYKEGNGMVDGLSKDSTPMEIGSWRTCKNKNGILTEHDPGLFM